MDSEPSNNRSEPQQRLARRLTKLETMLRRTRRSQRTQALFEGGIWCVAALSAVVVSTLLAGILFPAAVPTWTGWMLIVGVTGATVVAATFLVAFLSEGEHLADTARELQQADSGFRNDIVAALEFARRLLEEPEASDRELGFSRVIAREHVDQTVRRVEERAESGQLSHLLPTRSWGPPSMAASGGVAVLLAVGLLAPGSFSEIALSPVHWGADRTEETDTIVRPILGNLRLQISAPGYTGKGRRTEPFSSGHIRAVAGSEVTLTGQPLLSNYTSLEMVISTGDGERSLPLKSRSGGGVGASMVVTQSGHYQLQATREDGTVITDGVQRDIDVIPDEAPNVSITSHQGEVEVSPEDVLDIEYTVSDDFGIQELERVHFFAGDEASKDARPLKPSALQNSDPETVDGSLELDLRPLTLRPKDVVIFQIRATDNNSLTGPGVGKSQRLVLRVSSPEDKHLELLREQADLSEALLEVLADYLASPMGEREPTDDGTYRQVVADDAEPKTLAERFRALQSVHRREASVLNRMSKLVKRLKEDPLSTERDLNLFEGLHSHLSSLHARGESIYDELTSDGRGTVTELPTGAAQRVADHAATMEENLEKAILQLMELIASQKMDAVEATRADIDELRGRLKELLQKYKKTQDPDLKEAIKREMRRLRQRMSELMRRMQMQIRELPEEHLNKDALKKARLESDTRKMTDQLKSMEEMIEQGDIDGALKALEQMGQNMEKFGEQMKSQFDSAQPKSLSKLDKKMSELMDDVNDLQSMEKDLEEKTRELKERQEKRRKEEIESMLREFTEEMKKKVAAQREDLENVAGEEVPSHLRSSLREASEQLDNLKSNLEQNDIEQALEAAQSSRDTLETLRFNMEFAQRHARSGSKQAEALREAMPSMRRMVPRSRDIQERLEQMMQRAKQTLSQPDRQKLKQLQKRQKQVGERASEVEKKIEEASKEFPMLKQQLQPSLQGARKQMGEAEKRLGEGKPQGALDAERSALEQLGKLKKQMRRTMQKQRQKGGRSTQQREEVEIPGQDEGATRQELRDEVMDAMKEGKIEDYEKEIERYYKSLVE
jgi:hypothetical protein